jgi:hypothetical protein
MRSRRPAGRDKLTGCESWISIQGIPRPAGQWTYDPTVSTSQCVMALSSPLLSFDRQYRVDREKVGEGTEAAPDIIAGWEAGTIRLGSKEACLPNVDS